MYFPFPVTITNCVCGCWLATLIPMRMLGLSSYRRRSWSSPCARASQQLRGGDDGTGNLGDLLVFVHRHLAHEGIGLFFRNGLDAHDQGVGAVDRLAVIELGLRGLKLFLELREGIVAADRRVENWLHTVLAEAIDDIGGDTGIDRGVDHCLVGMVDEHGNGPRHQTAHLEHLFENVAARAFEIDEDDVGIDCVDAVKQIRRVVDVNDARVSRRAQAFLENRRAQRILVDNGNAQIPAQRSSLCRRYLSSTLRARTVSARDSPGGGTSVWFPACRFSRIDLLCGLPL